MARLKKTVLLSVINIEKSISVTCNKSGITEYLKKKNQLKY